MAKNESNSELTKDLNPDTPDILEISAEALAKELEKTKAEKDKLESELTIANMKKKQLLKSNIILILVSVILLITTVYFSTYFVKYQVMKVKTHISGEMLK